MAARSRRLAAACAIVAALAFVAVPNARTADTPRVDLAVLVVDDGGEPVAAITEHLAAIGTPVTAVRLGERDRPRIDEGFLAGTEDGRPRARYQAVVVPGAPAPAAAPAAVPAAEPARALGHAETAALAAYERRFGIRQVDAHAAPGPHAAFGAPAWSGSLDGRTARVTPAGRAGPFGYLRGPVPFADLDPRAAETYGHLVRPGPDFTPYVAAAVPGKPRVRGALVGEHAGDGRRRLLVTFGRPGDRLAYRLLARGIVEWATQGVHLGAARYAFAVHVDGVFGSDARWDRAGDCTSGTAGCADLPPVRMNGADAAYARAWSADRDLTLDLVYSGGAAERHRRAHGGADALADRLITDREAYRWVNGTYDRAPLGCLRGSGGGAARCARDEAGEVRWTPERRIARQIGDNVGWGRVRNLLVRRDELVTAGHTGLAAPPGQPLDNPNLAPALGTTGVRWLASDRARDPLRRRVGTASTLPRHALGLFPGAGREEEQVDAYAYRYGQGGRAAGGAAEAAGDGCEDGDGRDPGGGGRCRAAPLDPRSGYRSHLVPRAARTALGHVLAADPGPHYLHQSNLAEDRIAYPLLDRVLADYRRLLTPATPLDNPRPRAIARDLQRRAVWAEAVRNGEVTAYRVGRFVTVRAPAGVEVPVTAPPGARQRFSRGEAEPGSPYAGRAAGWTYADPDRGEVVLRLP
ncbi:hypothetical protein O7599_31925 [Streptomyces sp. WMMC500]|uniref:hypothetical protein n=1 Tax=Streptomyces sp. WMMC500 TaxID=3015154 RepID=UPI00248B2F6E|nr:hypothetical protein [Streptomyces sp. WMMC500]WBB60098.1 hypothetical protein O7599_31925 [Streptomyces sp. WMMC500]